MIDADVKPGHAYVEVSGSRIDVGVQARNALVRAALGLDREITEHEFDSELGDQSAASAMIRDDRFGDDDGEALDPYEDSQEGLADPAAGLPDDEVNPE